MDHEKILEDAWSSPANTKIALAPADVNKILGEEYEVETPFTYTRTMLWDMEVHKARQPDKYIPYVVKPVSAEKFPSVRHGAFEDFTRVSEQRVWNEPSTYCTVIEQVRLDHENRRAFFIGVDEFVTPDGRRFVAGGQQPLFLVEHSALGSEDEPLNMWRIVHPTETVDTSLVELFQRKAREHPLSGFHEVYIRDDLHISLARKTK